MTDTSSELPNTMQIAIDVAVMKATQIQHGNRIASLEKNQTLILVGTAAAALSATATLIMFILAKVNFH